MERRISASYKSLVYVLVESMDASHMKVRSDNDDDTDNNLDIWCANATSS